MYAPFYRLYIDNDAKRDITEYVENFTYEDCIEEDSLLKINIRSSFAEELADDTDFVTGTIIAFQFGFMAGEISELHRARITDVKHKYRERVTMELQCLDLGTVVKRVTEQTIWKNKKSSDIAQEIASKYGLELEADPTTKVWDNIPQGNRDDFSFLRYLALREDGGNWICYIRNNTLYFVNRGTDKNSLLTFTWGDGDGTVVSFEPSIKESTQAGVSNKAVVATFDPYKGEYKPQVVDNNTEKPTGTTGEYKRVYNESGQVGFSGSKTKQSTTNKQAEVGKNITVPTKDKAEATNIGNSKKKKATLKSLEAKLVVNGAPNITPNNIITMNNVAKRYTGNWFVNKVTHTVTTSGFLTTMDLNKNGTKSVTKNKGTSNKSVVKAKDPNTSKGGSSIKSEVKVRVYDGDGNFKGYSSSNRNAKKGK